MKKDISVAGTKFAIATFALLSFMAVAGFAAWLLGKKPTSAAASVHTIQTAC
jgi:hypothetical protein